MYYGAHIAFDTGVHFDADDIAERLCNLFQTRAGMSADQIEAVAEELKNYAGGMRLPPAVQKTPKVEE